jgi:hypothetical protein
LRRSKMHSGLFLSRRAANELGRSSVTVGRRYTSGEALIPLFLRRRVPRRIYLSRIYKRSLTIFPLIFFFVHYVFIYNIYIHLCIYCCRTKLTL